MSPLSTNIVLYPCLQVPTKITKGQIEIISEVFLVPHGQKVRRGAPTYQECFHIPINVCSVVPGNHVLIQRSCRRPPQVGSSEAALLQKLNIRPFTYGLVIDCIYDNGSVFAPAVLDITDEDMGRKFANALGNVAALSLELGFPTLASLPHAIANAFRALVAVVVEGCENYSFEQAATIKVR